MSKVVNRHVPQKIKQVKIVPNAPWFDFEYSELRKFRRKAEKKFKKTGTEAHKNEFVNLRKQTTNLAFNKKREFHSNKIEECDGNSKSLFACVNKLLDIKQDIVLPTHDSNEELADKFNLFQRKNYQDSRNISTIRRSFKCRDLHQPRNCFRFF